MERKRLRPAAVFAEPAALPAESGTPTDEAFAAVMHEVWKTFSHTTQEEGMASTSDVYDAVRDFLSAWDRQGWMEAHGEWASSAWEDRRDTYTAAVAALAGAVKRLPSAERVDPTDLDEVRDALAALSAATEALDGQVVPEHDHTAEGVIDPDGIEDREDKARLDVSSSWEGWDCREGWVAWRVGDALYLNWYRCIDGYGRSQRHERDLWVRVDARYFAGEEE